MTRWLVIALAISASHSVLAQRINPSDCEDVAVSIQQEADTLERDARRVRSAEDADRADAIARMRSRASSVQSVAANLPSACGGRVDTLGLVLANIGAFLRIRFGDSEATRRRIEKAATDLQQLAQAHVNVQPGSYKMTYAVAELIFASTEE